MEHQPLKTPVGQKKNDIWAAYKELLAETQSKGNGTVSTTGVAKQARVEDSIHLAETMTAEGVIAFTENFAVDLKAAKDEYEQLKEAIEAKKAELKAVHDLEFTANSTVALVAAKDRVIAEKEEQAKTIIENAKMDAAEVKEEADQYARDLQTKAKEKSQADEKARNRMREEWDYAFSRQKQEKVDAVQDKINDKVKLIQAREDEVAEREANAEKLKAQVLEAEKALELAKADTDEKVRAAVGKAKGMAEREAEHDRALLESQHVGLTSKLESEKSHLRASLDDARNRIDALEKQIGAANERVTTIATGALKAGADAATITEVAKTVAAGHKNK